MSILEKYPELKETLVFRAASDSSLEQYITDKVCSLRHFAAGEEICSPSVSYVPVGRIMRGSATISSRDGGRNVLLRTVGAGALFGIANLYSMDAPFPSVVCAKTSCDVLFIEAEAVRSLIENDKAAMRSFMMLLGNRIIYLNKKINAFTAGSAERRLSLFLADNEVDGIFRADTSMTALAEMLDIGRASLYRALDALEADGLIERQDKCIIIKDKNSMLEKYFL